MAETGNVIGKVASVQGQAFAKGPDGAMHQIKVGDLVFEGEVIQTAAGGHVELAFRDGSAYFVRDKETVTLDGMFFGSRAAETGNVIGKVILVEGSVVAKGQDGTMRRLKLGDPVFEGEVIVTPANGRVELAFTDGTAYFLRDKETVTLDGMVFGGRTVDARDGALMPGRGGELDDIARAIEEGSSLDRLLEETAAGRSSILGKADDGHSFVQLLRIAEAIDPLGYAFGSGDGARQDDVVGGETERNAEQDTGNEPLAQTHPVLLSDASTAVNAVAEGAAVGTTVGITALGQDADAVTSVTYSLTNDAGGRFAINATTGVVTVAGALDYESAAGYVITVKATSSDGSSNTADFTIAVTNLDEVAPTISSGTVATAIAENSGAGQAIYTAVADDSLDVSAGVSFSL
ncbi:MAG: retention module-containing protein, partial [Sulfuritalea sp.]|nr:retention module-containing protein [Sulfuritalea sp.]